MIGPLTTQDLIDYGNIMASLPDEVIEYAYETLLRRAKGALVNNEP